ncbi:hypothetical protein A0H81_02984 [Grifola frondosa]|uniref:Uncharacterized protein n=1 Tax=Grifola frondosa TaxID=5627 RepID=A0A1C7MJJ4_GRIFR|nr:hypothetical protein A0H81_02984 [Grifola frondosa]
MYSTGAEEMEGNGEDTGEGRGTSSASATVMPTHVAWQQEWRDRNDTWRSACTVQWKKKRRETDNIRGRNEQNIVSIDDDDDDACPAVAGSGGIGPSRGGVHVQRGGKETEGNG